MKKKKYLPLYYEWMETGRLPKQNGICSEFGKWDQEKYSFDFSSNPLFLLMTPEPYKGGSTSFWAGAHSPYWVFGPLRQNIVLLMAAMAGELD